jgi:hypothetical protein
MLWCTKWWRYTHIDYGVYIRTDLYAHMLGRVESIVDGLSCVTCGDGLICMHINYSVIST